MNEIELGVRKILEEIVTNYTSEVGLDDDLVKFGLSSINAIKLVIALESKFEFEFDDEDLTGENFQTIGSIISYIDKKTDTLGNDKL